MKIIAFGHRKYVGKDTLCKMIQTRLARINPTLDVQIHGFADKMKDVTHQIFGWSGIESGSFYELEGNSKLKDVIIPSIGKSPRQLWIGVGNGIRSATGEDQVWADYLLNSIKCDVLLIKDLRFLGEVNVLIEHGAILCKINREDLSKETDGADEPLENYDGWNYVINSLKHDYTPMQLAVDTLVKEIL